MAMVLGTAFSIFGLSAREQEQLTLDALDRVEESLAVGFLRSLGHFKEEEQLNDFELAALTELASLPLENDRVRVLFIQKALEKPETAGQFGRRLEEALVAAVGLRQDLREVVTRVFAHRFRDKDTPEQTKVVCAQGIGLLGCTDPELAAEAYLWLLHAIDLLDSPQALPGLLRSAASLTPALPRGLLPAIARRIVDLAAKKPLLNGGMRMEEKRIEANTAAVDIDAPQMGADSILPAIARRPQPAGPRSTSLRKCSSGLRPRSTPAPAT
jgi:hypothetical protein